MKKRVFALILSILWGIIGLNGCADKGTADDRGGISESIQFPEYFEKSCDKFHFQADVVIADGVDVSQVGRRRAERACYDNNKAYEQLFGNVEADLKYRDGSGRLPYEVYGGTNYEMLSMDGWNLNFSLRFASDIHRCTHLEKRDPEDNMDRYQQNGELDFMRPSDGEQEIVSILADIGFEGEFDFFTTVYAMNYQTLAQEEHAVGIEGNEDRSRYKEVWTEADNCYYYFMRQKVDGLPVYYLYGDVFKELDVCNSGVNGIYSKDGLQSLVIDKLFVVDTSEAPEAVSFMPLEELAQKITEEYRIPVYGASVEVHRMELYLMAKEGWKAYELFPVWILSMEQIETKNGEEIRTPLQAVIDAETGKIIS